jgi:hypothetical protein
VDSLPVSEIQGGRGGFRIVAGSQLLFGCWDKLGKQISISNNLCMWGWIRKRAREGFPNGFRKQRIRVESALAVAELPPAEIARYFRQHPGVAEDLLSESSDKRYDPSTFITEESDGFSVGWHSRLGYQCTHRFSNLADAATDYLLFSLGKGRWTSPETADPN